VTYPTCDEAQQRVETIKANVGAWPAIIGPYPGGPFRLSYDPEIQPKVSIPQQLGPKR